MADQKLTQILANSPDTTPTVDDAILTVNDPTGTPVNKGVLLGNLPTSTPTQTALDSKVQVGNDIGGTITAPVVAKAYQPTTQRLPNSIVTLITAFQSGHGFTKTSPTGTQTDDTADFIRGSQSLKLTTNGAGGACYSQKTGLSLNITSKQFVMWVKADAPTNLTELFFYFSSDNLTANWITVKPSNDIRCLKANTWTRLTFSQGRDAQVTGTPNLASINSIQIRAKDDSTVGVNVWFNTIGYFDTPSQGSISFTFDDGFGSQYSLAKPALDKYGYPATAYIIPAKVDTSNYMSLAQVKNLQLLGWDISNHTYDHPDLTTLTDAQIEAEFYNAKRWFVDNGFTKGIHDLALPHGAYNETSVLPIAKKYFRSVRTIVDQVETLAPGDHFKLRVKYVINTMTLAAVKIAVDQAIANKEWLILVFHDIQSVTASQDIQWLSSDFASLVDYVNSSNGTVKTVADILNNANPDKASVGLGNVDNTSDTTKPVSTAAQTALNLKQAIVKTGIPKISGGALQYGIPGMLIGLQGTSALVANTVRYIPWYVPYAITLTALQLEVTAGPAADGNIRVGIYAADSDLQPTGAPLLDSGSIAVLTAFTGIKSQTSLSVVLQPGAYIVAINSDQAMTLRTLNTLSPFVGTGMGATALPQRFSVSQTYASLPTPGTKWTSISSSTAGMQHSVVWQWTE